MFAKMMTRCAIVAGMFALVLLPLSPTQSRADDEPLYVQKITCVNEGGFVMNFWVDWPQGNRWLHTDSTRNYPVGQQETIDLKDYGIPDGADIWPGVQAILGKNQDGPHVLKYSPNGQTATFYIHGTTFDIRVDGGR